MPSSARIPQSHVPGSYVTRIREHVERDEVGAARRLLAEALREGSTEPGLSSWQKLLAPAKFLGFRPATGTDLRDEVRWLDEHGREYRGQWVAVLGDKMLAHAERYDDLRAQLAEIAPRAHPLVHFLP